MEEKNETAVGSVLAGYGGGEEMPLDGYAMLLAGWLTLFGGALVLGRRSIPKRWGPGDLLLTGIATHKLARIVTKDWVTSPVRAPFTTFRKSLGSGEVQESSRGKGLRRAVGDLLTCPWCIGPWIAGTLAVGWTTAPRATRLTAATFAAVALSDTLHQVYELLKHQAAGK